MDESNVGIGRTDPMNAGETIGRNVPVGCGTYSDPFSIIV
jgi:hypothetical protein